MNKLLEILQNKSQRDTFFMALGMFLLLAGQKLLGLAIFGFGAYGLEKQWRINNPDFNGNLSMRWAKAFAAYCASHKHPTSRKLHSIGIPMVFFGIITLLLATPFGFFWGMGAVMFISGWILNIVSHQTFENNHRSFTEDPLSWIAGPIYDLTQSKFF